MHDSNSPRLQAVAIGTIQFAPRKAVEVRVFFDRENDPKFLDIRLFDSGKPTSSGIRLPFKHINRLDRFISSAKKISQRVGPRRKVGGENEEQVEGQD